MKELNLIPADTYFLLRWNYRRVSIYLLLPALIVLSFVWRFQVKELQHTKMLLVEKKTQLERLDANKAVLNDALGKLNGILKDRAIVFATANFIKTYKEGGIKWSSLFETLSSAHFSNLWFTEMTLREDIRKGPDNEDIKVKRFIVDGRAGNMTELARLVALFEESGRFENIVLKQSEKGVLGGREFYNFRISCDLKRS
ncbi:hypothetical protein DRQ05_00445 [bacterium]|nr:MAG: hypothetical protein DRQ05_00445 [bacterium]